MASKYEIRMAKIDAANFSKASKKWYGKYSSKKDFLFNVNAILRGSFERK
jgi:hypothetical protein